jgi:hypothetical protein
MQKDMNVLLQAENFRKMLLTWHVRVITQIQVDRAAQYANYGINGGLSK